MSLEGGVGDGASLRCIQGGLMKKWILPGLVMLVGAALIAVAVFRNLFAVGPAFESMIEDFRPWLTDDSIAALRTDLDGLEGAVTEFDTAMAPASPPSWG